MAKWNLQRERMTWRECPRLARRIGTNALAPKVVIRRSKSSDFRSGGCGGTSTSRAEIRWEEQHTVLCESIRSDFAPALRKVNGAIPHAWSRFGRDSVHREEGGGFSVNLEPSPRGGACRAAFRDPDSAKGLGKPDRAIGTSPQAAPARGTGRTAG